VTRKRFEASDSVSASHRLVCTYHSTGYRAECHFAVGQLQLAKCFRAVFKLDHGLPGWGSTCGDFFLPIERLERGSVVSGVRQSAHFTGYHDRVLHRFRAQLRSARIFRLAGYRPKIAFLARDLGQTRRVVERMQCPRESLLVLLGFGWTTCLRHEFPRLAQRIVGLSY
jgi:hypothetical protein